MAATSEMSESPEQYAYRAQKVLGLFNGAPSYTDVEAFPKPEVPARIYAYSPDGQYFAYVVPGSVKIHTTADSQLFKDIPVASAIEIKFSPLGNFLSSWERLVKLEDGAQHKNLRIFSVATGEEVASFTQKTQEFWDVQYTSSESHAVRQVGPDIQVFDPSDWSKGVVDKLKVEGLSNIFLGPGKNPCLAVFITERKGAPATIRLHSLPTLSASPATCQKTFYKADQTPTVKWNSLGTQVLVMTHTDVDKSNKSYYGESGLYLLSAGGEYDCRITLDKEGPIHDFAWNPNAKEFGVVYGYMPSKAVLFSSRMQTTANFGSSPWNFISFNPQGRLVCLAGFGNLAGKMSIYDRRSLEKVCEMSAPNSSVCLWDRTGKMLMTATLSPRLRVDNGIKVWWCNGTLLHVHMVDELYQAGWRGGLLDQTPAFPAAIPPAPPASESVVAINTAAQSTPQKPAGAYRPPGARGLAAPSIYKREDEGGLTHSPSSSNLTSRAGTPNRENGGRYVPGSGGRERERRVPGAPPKESRNADGGAGEGRSRKKGKKEGQGSKREKPDNAGTNGHAVEVQTVVVDAPVAPTPASEPATPAIESSLDPAAKKIRNLTKKLKAIEELKERVQKGDKLEATQLKKIDGEADIRKELSSLGA